LIVWCAHAIERERERTTHFRRKTEKDIESALETVGSDRDSERRRKKEKK